MICLTAVMFTTCTQKYPGYKKTSEGLYYKFYSNNATAVKPELTDFLRVDMVCYLNDSLYFDWRESENEVYAQLTEPRFPADLHEAYAMMHVGTCTSSYDF